MDHLTREITPSSAIDLVAGCALVAGIIEKEQPDIVFFPLRGAGPIEWATQEILELDKAPVPEFVDLPLGTHHDLQTRRSSNRTGLTGQEKISIVNTAIGRLARAGTLVPNSSRLMLVDEVQKGRTITQAAEALRRATMNLGDNQTIDVVAVQAVHDSPNGVKKTQAF